MFPTGNLVDEIDVPNIGRLKATLINAGIPTVFLNAADLGYTGKELQDDINNDAAANCRIFPSVRYGNLKPKLRQVRSKLWNSLKSNAIFRL